jgi:NAD(P)-dependent dehydrogenase (short-subunit alcohol dehydrogenase family)
MVSARGGVGIAVRTDHRDEHQVAALCERIRREQGRLDVLVNDISEGEQHDWKPFWQLDLEKVFRALHNGVHSHIITGRHAAPLMVERRCGLIVEIGDGDGFYYRGQLAYDLVKLLTARLAWVMAEELHRHRVAAVAITPGFMRTEMVLDHFGVREENWREGGAKDPNFLNSETPFFVGRAVAAVAADRHVLKKSGALYTALELAREYGFTDVDGRLPDIWSALPTMIGRPKTGVIWEQRRVS